MGGRRWRLLEEEGVLRRPRLCPEDAVLGLDDAAAPPSDSSDVSLLHKEHTQFIVALLPPKCLSLGKVPLLANPYHALR